MKYVCMFVCQFIYSICIVVVVCLYLCVCAVVVLTGTQANGLAKWLKLYKTIDAAFEILSQTDLFFK